MIGEVAALSAACFWALGSHLWARIGRGAHIAPGALNLGKCVAAGGMFAVTGLVMRGRIVPSVEPRALAMLALSGVLGLTLGDTAYFGCLAILGVRRALLLLSTAPIFTALGGALWLDEPLRARDVVAVAVALAGVAIVVNEQASVTQVKGKAWLGVVLGLGAGLGQAAGALMSRLAMNESHVSPLDTSLVRLLAGIAGMVVFAFVTRRLAPWTRALRAPGLPTAILGAAFVGSYCGIWLAQLAIGQASSTAVASTLLATSPLFALPLSRILEGERVRARAVGGTLLACAGLAGLVLGRS